ncbi:MAG: MBL fold metallo-hydrolase [Bdellovibrionota bacterium]|nr:MBL fold metallo-hydrolase [Bdellovibrionota bacterium]
MKLLNIGGATAILENNGKRMMFDPWLDDGIFHGSWAHFPPANFKMKDIPKLDYLFISHIHEDHCSIGTIKHINKDCEVIIMDRKPNFVMNFIKKHKLEFKKIHLIKERTPTEIAPGLTIDFLSADPNMGLAYLVDSAVVIKWGDKVIYNANDCTPYEDGINYIKENYPQVDLALMPYAAGSSYPACYTNLSEEEKRSEMDRVFNACAQSFVHFTKMLNPKRSMPFADQYCIIGERSDVNEFLPHPPGPGCMEEICKTAGIGEKLLLLNSGQSYDFTDESLQPNEPFKHFVEQDRIEHVKKLNERKWVYEYENLDFEPSIPVNRMLQYARNRMWEQQKRDNFYDDDFRYYVRLSDTKRMFTFNLKDSEVEEVPFDTVLPEPYLGATMPHNLLILVLLGQISWNIADCACFIDYERVPNQYKRVHNGYWNYLRI